MTIFHARKIFLSLIHSNVLGYMGLGTPEYNIIIAMSMVFNETRYSEFAVT